MKNIILILFLFLSFLSAETNNSNIKTSDITKPFIPSKGNSFDRINTTPVEECTEMTIIDLFNVFQSWLGGNLGKLLTIIGLVFTFIIYLITKNKPALFIGIPISLISGGMIGVSTIFFDAGKPAIYLYPRKKQKISVWLKIKGIITKSIPDYDNGWHVDVEPSGLINGKYDYLFYETTQDKIDVPNEGWIIENKNIEEWFLNKLNEFNFNKKELDEFMDYWMPLLSEVENKYIDIRLFTEEYLDEHMELIIDPKPDRTYRYEFIFNGVDEYKELTTPNVEVIDRDGYIAVEWGGGFDIIRGRR